jgi:hypothetical protein
MTYLSPSHFPLRDRHKRHSIDFLELATDSIRHTEASLCRSGLVLSGVFSTVCHLCQFKQGSGGEGV